MTNVVGSVFDDFNFAGLTCTGATKNINNEYDSKHVNVCLTYSDATKELVVRCSYDMDYDLNIIKTEPCKIVIRLYVDCELSYTKEHKFYSGEISPMLLTDIAIIDKLFNDADESIQRVYS